MRDRARTGQYDDFVASSFLQVISDATGRLSKSEQRVADYVLSAPTEIVHATLAKVAESASVSEPTVIRFCTSLGFSGFQEFRLRMAQFMALGVPATHSAINDDDSLAVITSKIFDHTIASLDHTRNTLSVDVIEKAVTLIEESDRLHFYGYGASAVIAEDAAQKAPLFGRPCSALDDPHQQFIMAAMANTGDTFVLISHTGTSDSLLKIAEEVRRNQGRVILITGDTSSPLNAIADLTIETQTLENTDLYTPTISRLAGLMVIDVLTTVMASRSSPEMLGQFRAMKTKLADFRNEH